jgi:Lrp/AsnC family transcriptional regulator for asnA, asnC and gidA
MHMYEGVDDKALRVDELDRAIIALLQPEGRMPFAEVATRLGVSEGTVRQRYRRLVNAGILQVVAVADPFKIGFNTIAHEIALFPEVSYVVMSTGGFDLLVEVIAQDSEEFVRFLTEKLHRVEGVIKTETFMLLRVYKMNLGGWRMAQIRAALEDEG